MKKCLSYLLVLAMLLAVPGLALGTAESKPFKPGTYTATAQGMHAPMVVEVVLTEDRIESVKVLEHDETKLVGDVAVDVIPQKIVEFQSLAVDSISSATVSSMAIKSAVADCVKQAGGDVSAVWNKEIPAVPPLDEAYEFDLVVVGGGLAGLTAATAAIDTGISVALIEKEGVLGGTSVLAEGYMATTGKIGADGLYDLLVTRGKEKPASVETTQYPEDKMIRALANSNEKAVGLITDSGIKMELINDFQALAVMEDGTLNREVRTGWRIIDALRTRFESKGGEVLLNTPGTSLMTQDGVVTGILSEGKEGKRTFNAKAVILASGDFANNADMMKAYAPQHTNCYTISTKGNVGDGMTMALAVGAQPYEDQYVQGGPLIFNPYDIWRGSFSSPEFLTNSMLVSLKGERKIAETQGTRPIQYTYMNGEEPDGAWTIMDADIAADLPTLDKYLAATSENSVIKAYKAESIQELAELAGMDPVTLENSVKRYNELCAAGEDKDFGKAPELMVAIDQAPYYALRGYAINRGSIGGVKINEHCQILDGAGAPIQGLYGAGMFISRPFFGGTYHGGSAMFIATTTGYMAGSHAASEIASAK